MRLLTDAVLTRLKTNSGSFKIGDGQAPADDTRPYAVLYALDESEREGDMSSAVDVTGWFEYQVTSVGDTREQAEGLADLLRTLILASNLTPTGFSMFPWRKLVTNDPDRDDSEQPPLFYVTSTVEAFVAPTS
ncbi:MAG: hypothetical protein IIC02_13190 [Planctomycetes bacterium]|nr:hypothetical protein [Planctomycetota bacterium]